MSWQPDILEGYEALTLPLDVPPAPGEPEDVELVATLVRRVVPATESAIPRTAALYLHGWNDYFFQTHLADAFAESGIDFYALDLRRYGRSLRPGQLRNFVADLDDYDDEIGQAVELITSDHERLIMVGHSTGGLIAALWADRHADRVDAMVLNSPWLDLQGSPMLRTISTPVIDTIGTNRPTSILPRPGAIGFYARAIHLDHGGEWDYDLELKTSTPPPVYLGWLRAVLKGHARVATGLDLECPIVVLASTTTDFSRRWHDGLRAADTVLDVKQIARRAVRLGRHVTVLRVEGGLHDIVLSAPEVRKAALADLRRWLEAYVPTRSGAA